MLDCRSGRGMAKSSMNQEQMMMDQQQQQQMMNRMHRVRACNMMARQQMQKNQMNAMQMRSQGMMGGAQVGIGGIKLINHRCEANCSSCKSSLELYYFHMADIS